MTPRDLCECGATKLRRARRCRACAHVAQKGKPKTMTPSLAAGRYRARVAVPEGVCEYEGCGSRTIERHHKDGDPLNNDPGNIAVLCRLHHMTVDGRLEQLRARAHAAGLLGGRPKMVNP